MATKKKKALRKKWIKYLKDSRLSPDEQKRRVDEFTRKGLTPA